MECNGFMSIRLGAKEQLQTLLPLFDDCCVHLHIIER